MRTATWTESVSVLDRVSAILDAFGDDRVLGVNEIARRANLPKSTVSRIAAELVDQHWLDRIGNDLYVGLSLYELGQAVEQPRQLRDVAQPLIARLRHMTGETVQLSILDGADAVRVSAALGRTKLPARLPLGERSPAHSSAAGKALLAFASDALPAEIAAGPAPVTITNALELQRQLAEARRTRIATDSEEAIPGIASVASPIFDSDASLIGAVSIVGIAENFDITSMGRAVRTAALGLNQRISELAEQ